MSTLKLVVRLRAEIVFDSLPSAPEPKPSLSLADGSRRTVTVISPPAAFDGVLAVMPMPSSPRAIRRALPLPCLTSTYCWLSQ